VCTGVVQRAGRSWSLCTCDVCVRRSYKEQVVRGHFVRVMCVYGGRTKSRSFVVIPHASALSPVRGQSTRTGRWSTYRRHSATGFRASVTTWSRVKASSFSGSREIPLILCNWNVHYRVDKIVLTCRHCGQYSSSTHPHNILPSTRGSSRRSLSTLPCQNSVRIFLKVLYC
jgi:hypothetical protein